MGMDVLGITYEENLEVNGYIADVVVLHHSPHRTLHLRTHEPLGQTMMRQRHLRDCGYLVVNIWDRIWNELDDSERVTFLRARIPQAQELVCNNDAGVDTGV